MFNADTEIIIPSRIILNLRNLRGKPWQELIDSVCALEPENKGCIAFILMMARINGCLTCNSDSFRAMKGCTQCSRHMIRRYRGSDQDLANLFQQAMKDVENYLAKAYENGQIGQINAGMSSADKQVI